MSKDIEGMLGHLQDDGDMEGAFVSWKVGRTLHGFVWMSTDDSVVQYTALASKSRRLHVFQFLITAVAEDSGYRLTLTSAKPYKLALQSPTEENPSDTPTNSIEVSNRIRPHERFAPKCEFSIIGEDSNYTSMMRFEVKGLSWLADNRTELDRHMESKWEPGGDDE